MEDAPHVAVEPVGRQRQDFVFLRPFAEQGENGMTRDDMAFITAIEDLLFLIDEGVQRVISLSELKNESVLIGGVSEAVLFNEPLQAFEHPVENARQLLHELVLKIRVKLPVIGELSSFALLNETHREFNDEPPTHEAVGGVIDLREEVTSHHELRTSVKGDGVFVLVAVFENFASGNFLEDAFRASHISLHVVGDVEP